MKLPRLCDQRTVRMAGALRKRYHGRLDGARIIYAFVGERDGAAPDDVAWTILPSGATALVAPADYLVELLWPAWATWSTAQRRAVLDHELSHAIPIIGADGVRRGWGLRDHDVAEFAAVVERHGASCIV